MPNLVTFAMYKPKEGKMEELKFILKEQVPTLRKYDLITNNETYLAESGNGTLVEIFIWKDEASKDAAHKHPAIRAILGKMMNICSFPPMADLEEVNDTFPSFRKMELEH